MPFPTDTFLQFFRNSSNYIAQEFENFYAQLTGYLSKEHKDDGSHKDITANSVTTDRVAWDDGSSMDVEAGRLTLRSSEPMEVKTSYSGDPSPDDPGMTFGEKITALAGNPKVDQFHRAVEFEDAVRFAEQSSYAASLNDLQALTGGADAPDYVVYRVTSGNLRGITSGSVTLGQRGQAVIVINDKGSDLAIDSNGLTSGYNKILNPVTLTNGGAALLVYNNSGLGWHVIAAHGTTRGYWTAYTPTFTSTGTAPTNFSVSGKYTKVGKTVYGEALVVCGASWTAGTGSYTISLPETGIALGATARPCGSAVVYDASTGFFYRGIVVKASTTTVQVQASDAAGPMSGTVPLTFAASDQIGISFSYEVA